MPNLTDTDLTALRQRVGQLIPASVEYNTPGADDAQIFAEIVAVLRANPARLDMVLTALRAEQNAPALISVVAQCYYRDDRVLLALGMEPRAPFPKGYEIKEGDWSLLEPVREKASLWRKV